jgi:hypothetical protein
MICLFELAVRQLHFHGSWNCCSISHGATCFEKQGTGCGRFLLMSTGHDLGQVIATH